MLLLRLSSDGEGLPFRLSWSRSLADSLPESSRSPTGLRLGGRPGLGVRYKQFAFWEEFGVSHLSSRSHNSIAVHYSYWWGVAGVKNEFKIEKFRPEGSGSIFAGAISQREQKVGRMMPVQGQLNDHANQWALNSLEELGALWPRSVILKSCPSDTPTSGILVEVFACQSIVKQTHLTSLSGRSFGLRFSVLLVGELFLRAAEIRAPPDLEEAD